MKGISTLKEFLDNNNILYCEFPNKIDIYRRNSSITLEEYMYNTDDRIIYFGTFEAFGISTIYHGDILQIVHNKEDRVLEISFLNKGAFSNSSNCIIISEEF